MRARFAIATVTAAFVVAACSSSDSADDSVGPACNGVSATGLAMEQTAAGQCPASPRTLTGTATVGQACSDSTDCAPLCCQCEAGGSAVVAQCSNGNCLDGSTTCCLYSAQCGQ
jgi:hypothetical protein